jgi:hypothetical protein
MAAAEESWGQKERQKGKAQIVEMLSGRIGAVVATKVE